MHFVVWFWGDSTGRLTNGVEPPKQKCILWMTNKQEVRWFTCSRFGKTLRIIIKWITNSRLSLRPRLPRETFESHRQSVTVCLTSSPDDGSLSGCSASQSGPQITDNGQPSKKARLVYCTKFRRNCRLKGVTLLTLFNCYFFLTVPVTEREMAYLPKRTWCVAPSPTHTEVKSPAINILQMGSLIQRGNPVSVCLWFVIKLTAIDRLLVGSLDG